MNTDIKEQNNQSFFHTYLRRFFPFHWLEWFFTFPALRLLIVMNRFKLARTSTRLVLTVVKSHDLFFNMIKFNFILSIFYFECSSNIFYSCEIRTGTKRSNLKHLFSARKQLKCSALEKEQFELLLFKLFPGRCCPVRPRLHW